MKKSVKFLAALLALSVVFGFAACKNDDDDEDVKYYINSTYSNAGYTGFAMGSSKITVKKFELGAGTITDKSEGTWVNEKYEKKDVVMDYTISGSTITYSMMVNGQKITSTGKVNADGTITYSGQTFKPVSKLPSNPVNDDAIKLFNGNFYGSRTSKSYYDEFYIEFRSKYIFDYKFTYLNGKTGTGLKELYLIKDRTYTSDDEDFSFTISEDGKSLVLSYPEDASKPDVKTQKTLNLLK